MLPGEFLTCIKLGLVDQHHPRFDPHVGWLGTHDAASARRHHVNPWLPPDCTDPDPWCAPSRDHPPSAVPRICPPVCHCEPNSSRRPPPSHLAGSPGAYWASQCQAIPTVCICWGCDVPGCPLAGALYSFNSKSASRCSPTPPPPLDPHTRTLWVPLGYIGHPNAGQY